jgi:sugar phosphate permease
MRALFHSFEQSLSGWPDTILSISLIVSGIVVICVGLFAPRTIKLVVLAWIWFP